VWLVGDRSVSSAADAVMQSREQPAVAWRWREVWRRGMGALFAVRCVGLLNHSVGG